MISIKVEVVVRCITFNHAPYIQEALNGFTMQKTTFPFVCTIIDDASTDGEQDVIKKYLEDNSSPEATFAIVTIENDKMIGTVGLENVNSINRTATLGIFIGDKDYRDKGYGTEAIRLILEYGFKYLNLHSIRLDLLAVNERAHKCYLKCGFKDTGKSREEIFLNGKYYDKLHMDILEDEFEDDYIRNKNVK